MLQYVTTMEEIKESLQNFNDQAPQFKDFARVMVRQTSYWVYDPLFQTFGPNKFVGFRSMTIPVYQQTLQESYGDTELFKRFHAVPARQAIEQILGTSYHKDYELSASLEVWAESLLGHSVLARVSQSKWKFVQLD